MQQEPYVTMNDKQPVETTVIDENFSNDQCNINGDDPLNPPLFGTNEFQFNENETKSSTNLSVNCNKKTNKNLSLSIIYQLSGIFYALLGSSLFTLTSFAIKQLRVDFFEALILRFIIQTIVLSIFIISKHYKIVDGSVKLILLQIVRLLSSCGGLFLFYSSYHYIPLSDLTTFRYTQVVWTAILAVIIFRERLSIATIFAIILTLIGVILVAQPTFLFVKNQQKVNQTNDEFHRIIGICLALACALSISSSIVLNKKLLILKVPLSVLMFHFSLLNLFILILNHIRNRFILNLYATQSMFTKTYFLASAIGLIQIFSSTIIQKAIKLEHPSIISVVQSSDILFSILLQNLFTTIKSDWLSLFGSTLVTTAIFLVGIHKFSIDKNKKLNSNV